MQVSTTGELRLLNHHPGKGRGGGGGERATMVELALMHCSELQTGFDDDAMARRLPPAPLSRPLAQPGPSMSTRIVGKTMRNAVKN